MAIFPEGNSSGCYLARALAQETSVMLLDEPTSHLDLQFQVNIMKRVYDLAHPARKKEQIAGAGDPGGGA